MTHQRSFGDRASLAPYIGCMRGSWSEGSYAEDFERHAKEGDRNGTFLL
jgi:hypothetical protein